MSNNTVTVPGLDQLSERHRIRLIIQFGSTVTGHIHPRSDIDLALLLENPEMSLHMLLEIQEGFQELFPGQTVDLAFINRADPLFLKKIVERCRLLYGDPLDLARLRLYAFKRYQDHQRFLALERRYVDRELARYGRSA